VVTTLTASSRQDLDPADAAVVSVGLQVREWSADYGPPPSERSTPPATARHWHRHPACPSAPGTAAPMPTATPPTGAAPRRRCVKRQARRQLPVVSCPPVCSRVRPVRRRRGLRPRHRGVAALAYGEHHRRTADVRLGRWSPGQPPARAVAGRQAADRRAESPAPPRRLWTPSQAGPA